MTEIVTTIRRKGEAAVEVSEKFDAGLFFIGRIRTPWIERQACPRRGDAEAGPLCRIEVSECWWPALEGIEVHPALELLYWMHLARRDLVRQNPKSRGELFGTFALRSPNRPNPIASSKVKPVAVEVGVIVVRGLDCVDDTPLVDIKPSHCPMCAPGIGVV